MILSSPLPDAFAETVTGVVDGEAVADADAGADSLERIEP